MINDIKRRAGLRGAELVKGVAEYLAATAPVTREAKLVTDWLSGDIKEGSPRDLQARRIIVRELRSMDGNTALIRLLAVAIDPDTRVNRIVGRLVMQRRWRGARQRANPLRIAAFIYQRTKPGAKDRVPVESAVKAAEEKFGVRGSTAYKAWSDWRPHIEQNPGLGGRF